MKGVCYENTVTCAHIGAGSVGGIGQRITIIGGAGTFWNVDFAVDGFLEVLGGGPLVEGTDAPGFFYDAGLAVYQAGQVDYNSFVPGFNDFTAVFYDHDPILEEIDTSQEESYYELFAQVGGSIYLESDYEVFDIFTFTNMVVNSQIGDGLESYIADLTQTARYVQTLASGVSAFSSSGQFLALTTPPSPPSSTA